jgi:hypothetical protein
MVRGVVLRRPLRPAEIAAGLSTLPRPDDVRSFPAVIIGRRVERRPEALAMRTVPVAIVLWIAAMPSPVWSQIQQFPYEAVVQGDDVHVRCGPGLKYYPTGKLRFGDRVTVHRHDPGGWYMVAPPPGSFSWIAASEVRKTSDKTGEVLTAVDAGGQSSRVFVRVGSQLSDDCSLFSIEMQAGDQVEIVGEKTLTLDRGATLMYQIKPPPQEFRWVKGDYILPAGMERAAPERDPFAVSAAQKSPEVKVEAFNDQPTATLPRPTPLNEATPVAPLASDVEALDQQFTEMLAADPASWRLDEFDARFRELLPASDSVNASLIRTRLQSIAARKQAQADYLDFVRLTNETTQREEQLRAMQQGGIPAQPAAYPQVQLGAPQPVPNGAPTPASLTGPNGARLQGPVPHIDPIPDAPANALPGGQVMPKFDGAGIVQRSGNPLGTVPPYVLVAPNGKLLAFLEPGPGANLEPYVGKSMGIIGQRGFDARLQADRIVVRKMQPVQIGP